MVCTVRVLCRETWSVVTCLSPQESPRSWPLTTGDDAMWRASIGLDPLTWETGHGKGLQPAAPRLVFPSLS